jgi:hypothetical protein
MAAPTGLSSDLDRNARAQPEGQHRHHPRDGPVGRRGIVKDETVRTELEEDFANEQLKVRVRIGKRAAVFAVYNADVERLQGDRAVAQKVERLIQEALSELVR